MKVKIVSGSSLQDIEKGINDFLENNSMVQDIKFTYDAESGYGVAMIIYMEEIPNVSQIQNTLRDAMKDIQFSF